MPYRIRFRTTLGARSPALGYTPRKERVKEILMGAGTGPKTDAIAIDGKPTRIRSIIGFRPSYGVEYRPGSGF